MNAENRVSFLYGPPASGKTTLAEQLCTALSFKYVSVGNLTRIEIQQNTPIGMELAHFLNAVLEYPVELISSLIEKKLIEAKEQGRDVLLDGYPKYPREAEAFQKLVKKHNIPADCLIVIKLSLVDAIRRSNLRRICEDCLHQTQINPLQPPTACSDCSGKLIMREDDTPLVLARRYNDYRQAIKETLKVLQIDSKKTFCFDGRVSKEKLLDNILTTVLNARVAQQRERLHSMQEVGGSSPSSGS